MPGLKTNLISFGILDEQGLLGKPHFIHLILLDMCSKQAKHIEFSKGNSHGKDMSRICADLWGPAKVQTHKDNKYFLPIIDDYRRKVWIYLLKSKYQTFKSFKN